MYNFFWCFKYYLFAITLLVFGFCLYQLSDAKIYFDSERIINELEATNIDINVLDDNNLVFFGVSFSDSLSYQEMLEVNAFHKELKSSKYVKRVFSIINDRELINTGLFPISKRKLNLKNDSLYNLSKQKIVQNQNNFISQDGRKLLFLVENESALSKSDNQVFIDSLYATTLTDKMLDVYISGRSPSELYFSKKVIQEFIILTIISGLLCFLFLLFITQNIRLVSLTVFSVIASIVITLGISQTIFGGIELVMIITPAILFIVCLSDIMHLTNKQEKKGHSVDLFFKKRMNTVGKAVALTSITTAMSFLTFLVNDIVPILRFGIITSIGVVTTLFVAMLVYAISVDKNFNQSTPIPFFEKNTNRFIAFLKNGQTSRVFHLFMFLFIVLGFYGVSNVKIDNYLTDEINKKSEVYQQTAFFDTHFGGIKPITVFLDKDKVKGESVLVDIEDELKSLGFVVDFTNTDFNGLMLDKMGFAMDDYKDQYFFICRTGDEGSLATLAKLEKLENRFEPQDVQFNYSGAGYLFDLLGNDLTKQLIYGLLLAIFSIGVLFFLFNNFDFNYFIIAILPNIAPIVVCVGILYSFGFYFSLSNAFIFTIVFGLIIDDSIHVISAYSNHRKRNVSKADALNLVVNNTGNAVIKTTLVVMICLLPIMFSEFKSVSQLSIITIISAIVAVFFDLVYLPLIIKRLTK
ncbi:MAG: MMPL family transporter [Flavobacteriales bacterium]|nr:MMPL family transporter [Flavobacteriales bacterium]